MFLRIAATALLLTSNTTAFAESGIRSYTMTAREGDFLRHSHRHGRNRYSGHVAIFYRPHVGTWSYGSASDVSMGAPIGHQVRIIDVKAAGSSACSYQAGVCVIRP